MIVADIKDGALWVQTRGTPPNQSRTRAYALWCKVKDRTSPRSHYQREATYGGCSLSPNFQNFQFFAEWCQSQVGYAMTGFQLDKDLLVKGNRVYAEDRCVFLPGALNTLLIKSDKSRGTLPLGVYFDARRSHYTASVSVAGKKRHLGSFPDVPSAFAAYKTGKEAYIKELAARYKGQIDPRAYETLLSYEVEESD